MRTVLLVARREITTQLRSRTFVVGILLMLLVFGGYGAVIAFAGAQSSSSSLVLDGPARELRGELQGTADRLGTALRLTEAGNRATAESMVRTGEADAMLTGAPGTYQLVGLDDVAPGLRSLVADVVEQQAVRESLLAAGADPERVSTLSGVGVRTLEPVDTELGQRVGTAFVVTFLLFFSVTAYGAAVAQGVVEEKSGRVVELLLATIPARQLLAGKVLGLGLVGLLQLLILGAVGAAVAVGTGALAVPALLLPTLVSALAWYLVGFFLFATLYAAAGALVSRQEELQSVTAPIAVVLLVPFLLAVAVLPVDPRNPVTTVLSFVPYLSQTLMPARTALGVTDWWEPVLAYALALLALAGMVVLSARVYRNSVLRTGARVRWRDALRTGRP
ncbi:MULTISPECIES: ABC transporter permease [Pseudonocardia]|uniref:ABC-2 type transport system permease protein n=1 Tax=Pseudonocardia alni TaxID=33907 RepID=A0A852VZ97_PSEA5|nr:MULTISPECIES: ABC transporter permease [Pseudonocardia]MCO7193178.1 ABC transporter permease [Pseudonocardia sp. McavD-2-B]NYG02248.1 ABC-2 type transport system permease protein [Pseudonocardia antarctica]